MQHSETLDLSVINIADSDVFSIKQSGNTKGYDGHCLRAFSYFGDQMPDIQLPEQGEACYMIDIEGSNYYFTATQEVSYKGQTYTGADFYKLVSENKL